MCVGQRVQDRGDRVPEVDTLRDHHIATDLGTHAVRKWRAWRDVAVDRDEWRHGRVVEHADVFGEPRDQEINIHPRKRGGCVGDAGVHHHVEPRPKPVGIELLVATWHNRTPQVEIEESSQLPRRRQRQQFTAVLESAMLNQPVEDFRLQLRHNSREVRGFQDAVEQPFRRTRTPNVFRHGRAMLPALARKKQS